jgi:hypothetical protein
LRQSNTNIEHDAGGMFLASLPGIMGMLLVRIVTHLLHGSTTTNAGCGNIYCTTHYSIIVETIIPAASGATARSAGSVLRRRW